MTIQIPVSETASLKVFKVPEIEGGVPLYDEPRTVVDVDLVAFAEARRDDLRLGQLLAAALGQERGTYVNGLVTTIDTILQGIDKAVGHA